VGSAALVGEQPLQFGLLIGRPVPHHVVAAVAGAQIVIRAGHWIAEQLLARRQSERHVFEQVAMRIARNRTFRDHRAPRAIAGIERHRAGQRLLAHGRARAVGAHQKIGLDRFAVGKPRQHRNGPGLVTNEPAPAVIALGRKGVAQQPVDALPGREHLRAMDLLGQLALGVEDLAGGDVHAERGGLEPQLTQALDQFLLGDDAGTAAGQFALHAFVDIHRPAGPAQHQGAQQAAHRAADDNRPGPGQWIALNLSVYRNMLYMSADSTGGILMALTMLDKAAEKKDKSQWPAEIAAEFAREANNPNPCVGSTLLSETERTRVWIIRLAPGERIGFHRHVLDYFWTAVSGGRGRQHVHDGTTIENSYQPGETRHETYGKGEFKVHDLENLGDRELVFMTVEFKDSANKPMPLPDGVRPQAAA